MKACLTRLGIRPEIQELLDAHCRTDATGNLCFLYGSDTEVYGLGFHRVPVTKGCWLVGPENFVLVRKVFICSSAMEAIAWLNCNFAAFKTIASLLFIAIGSNLDESHFKMLRNSLPGRKYSLIFNNDLLGRICDLKAAALLAGHSVDLEIAGDNVKINFRSRHFYIPCESFSLHAFERLSGYRFRVKTSKPSKHTSWLAQLQACSLNL